ncbi:MAG: leucyl aminopeptidase family protein [Elusimicrobiota bacterium]
MIFPSAIEIGAAREENRPEAFFVFEDGADLGAPLIPAAAWRKLRGEARAEGFCGKIGECFAGIPSKSENGKTSRRILVGLGEKKSLDGESARRAGAALCRFAEPRFAEIVLSAPASVRAAAAEGFSLASYRFAEYKKIDRPKLRACWMASMDGREKEALGKTLAKTAVVCRAVAFARDLVNRGASDKPPKAMAEIARSLAGGRVSVETFGRAKAEKLGMGAFLGVARGSADEPAFAHLVYKPSGRPRGRVGLIGKGITFDSGGLSLKAPGSMETMKRDMAGAAAVLAVFKALPDLELNVEAHGFCPFTYNLPGPNAIKPGDVLRAMSGKTIEVLNTDAEGRLILADALAYAAKEKLNAVVDVATLTGAVVTALGTKIAAVMGDDKALVERLVNASLNSGEPLWELPLAREYEGYIKSGIADLRNVGKPGGEAGTIVAGLFLREFAGNAPWAHLDIAGTAWTENPSFYLSAGATGAPVRTIIEYLKAL